MKRLKSDRRWLQNSGKLFFLKLCRLLFVGFFVLISRSVPAIEVVNNLSFDFYSQENGLSNNQIHCILQDKEGWMWFGTSQGVCRFDGYKFTVFKNDPEDSASLQGNLVRTMFEDHKGQLWVGTENGGLNKFNREKETFIHYFDRGKDAALNNANVNSICEDLSGVLWVGTDNRLYRVDNESKLTVVKPENIPGFSTYFRVVRTDKNGRIWAGTNKGLFVYDPRKNTAVKVTLPAIPVTNEEIWDITFEDDHTVWVGTYAGGLYIVNTATLEATHLVLDQKNDRSNTVRAISKDHNGRFWIGTRGGLYIYEKDKGTLAFYCHDEREPRSLVNNSVQCISHDRKGDVWIGTRSGINFLIEERQNIHGYKAMPHDNRYLNSSEIYAFWIDPSGNIWAGTENGGINILDRHTGTFKYLMPEKGNPNSLSRTCIKALLDDGRNNLWIGTFLGGLDVLNRSTGNFVHYRHDPENPASISDNRVWTLLKDAKGNIWIGTEAGLDRFDPQAKAFVHYTNVVNNQQVAWLHEDSDHNLWIGGIEELIIYNPENHKISRIPESTRNMLEDSNGKIWLATRNKGLALASKEKGIIRYYTEKNGLANNQTLAILEDNEHFLWISTTNGLSKFDPATEGFHNFSQKNGFLNNQFTYGAAYKSPEGELLFGGISGFNIFDPSKIKAGDYYAPIVITDLKIFNRSVKIGDRKKDILTKSITETEEIHLKYNQNSVTLEFASFDYANSLGLQYSYFLENFDKDWNEPSVSRSATYTNLDPGEYHFRIKTVSIDRRENNNGPVLTIIVSPPYWQTWWFRALIFLTVFGLLYLVFNFILNKEKLKNDLVLERMKAKKLHELDMMKLRFYTNISHEIRTPLTLILGPLEKMRHHSIPEAEAREHLNVMYRNASQLHQLINQLLDFRKLETGNLKINLSRGDLVSYLSGIVGSFEDFAREKEIELRFNSLKKQIVTSFDADKVAKIMNNLLSNALKFTGKGGRVSVNLSLVFDSDENEPVGESADRQMIEISVKDTGIGISESNLEKIFSRFFQVEDSAKSGTGIGLALTRELVKLHGGKIFVVSKPGKGSKFTVQLPYEDAAQHEVLVSRPDQSVPENTPPDQENDDAVSEQAAGRKIMLVVDDNADVRYFVKSHFQSSYQVIEAADGTQGWNLALKTIPDIIISDVMMPEIDGFELCRKIRKDERTSHIPILLLTALGSREHEIEGLSAGADDFITKPFDLVLLQTKVENMLSVRQSLKQKYAGEMLLQPTNVVLTSPDERFLQKAIEVVEKYISDPDLDIERFATEIGVSRMQLYRKLNAMTEMTVKEFIRNIRLKRAAQMLVQKKLNVSEIAYAVGFKDLSHFRKCFRQEFGMSATEYIERNN